jgi:hypothetical protein
MQPASTNAVPEESYPQPPIGTGNQKSPSATNPCSVLNPCPSPPQFTLIPSTAKSSSSGPLPGYLSALQSGLFTSLDTYAGPQFLPSDSPCVNCNSIASPQSIDLLADPRGQAVADALTPEQKKKLNEMIDDEVREKIKGLKYKPFEAAFEAQKTAIQEAVGEYGAALAVSMCLGNLACGVIGFGAGWYAAGSAFDKLIETPIDSITSGSPAPH